MIRRARVAGTWLRRRLKMLPRFRDLSLTWKLFIPTLAILLFTGLSVGAVVAHDLASRAQQTLDSDLTRRTIEAKAFLVDREFYLLESVRFGVNIQGLPEGLVARDRTALGKLAGSVAALKDRLDLLVVTDARGVAIVELSRHEGDVTVGAGRDWSTTAIVSDVLRPPVASVVDDKRTGISDKRTGIARIGEDWYFVASGPVTASGSVRGAVVAALGLPVMSDQAAARIGTGFALYDTEGHRIAASPNFASIRGRHPSGSQPVRYTDGRQAVMFSSFGTRGAPAGWLAVGLPTRGAFAAARATSLRIEVILTIGLAFGFALRRAATGFVLTELRPIIETRRALGRGDLGARAPVLSRDELGELAAGINEMAEELQARNEELELRVTQRTEELERMNAELAALTAGRTAFFAGLTHELRTPLNAIVGYADLILHPSFRTSGPSGRKDLERSVLTMKHAGLELLELVDDILDSAKFERQDIDLDLQDVNLSELMDELSSTLVPLARRSDIQLTFVVPRDLPTVRADAFRLRQIVLNIASNAIKYTPSGGNVRIVAASVLDRVEVAVSDTGVGIPMEAAPRIFEPFYRVAGTKAQKEQASSGLGLSVTKRLVEAHGGEIRFTSQPGEGTTFTFSLPRTASANKKLARAS